MVRETLLEFPSHTLPYRYRKYAALSTVSKELFLRKSSFFLHYYFFRRLSLRMASFVPMVCSTCTSSTSSTTATSITRYL